MKLINLHVNTVFSLLESTIELDSIIKWAKDNQIEYLAITENKNMFSFAQFCIKAKENNIKTIYGIQIKTSQEAIESDLIVIAKNLLGLKELFELNFYQSQNELVSQTYLKQFQNLIFIDHPTLGLFSQTKCKYTEIDTYIAINLQIIEKLKIDLNTINDQKFLYVNEGRIFDHFDNQTLETLEWIKTQNKTKRFIDILVANIETDDIRIQKLIEFTNNLAKSLAIEVPISKFKMPVYKNSENISSFEFLKKLVIESAKNKIKTFDLDEYKQRLTYELKIIKQLGFEDYFLIIWDFIKWAKTNHISIGPGRGSAAGSLISYLLGITQIDPIEYNLLFERFLNPKRISLPDIDIDVQDDKRQDLINYLISKYGKENVSSIITFSTLGSKSSMRDSARSFNVPIPAIDHLAKKIPNNLRLEEIYEQEYAFREELNKYKNPETGENDLKNAFNEACKIQGFYRQTGTHAAGIVISDQKIIKKSPIMFANDYLQTEITMDYLETFGLLKIDILGLKTLSIINDILLEIKKQNANFDIDDIPLNDQDTFMLLSGGKTAGIFQLESPGMRNTLMKVKVTDFNDIAAIISLFRPGPMQHIKSYANRKNQKEEIPKVEKIFDKVLEKTYGIMIYQEQVLEIVQKISNMDYAEADLLRRAISKKKAEEFLSFKDIFIKKAVENNYDKQLAENIFDNIESFAAYGFNKSHAVSYSLITYRMAYLKTHFPLEFYNAIISSSINSYEDLNKYISEAQELGISVVSPTINDSELKSIIKNKKIYLPLTMIKGFGKVGAENIVNERNKNGPFKNILETFLRLRAASIGESTLKTLTKASVFREFENQVSILNSLENSTAFKLELFNGYNTKTKIINWEQVNWNIKPIQYDYDYEFESKNEILYLGNVYNSSLTKQFESDIRLVNIHPGTQHKIAVFIKDAIVKTTKNNKPFTIVNLFDSSASIQVFIWNNSPIKEHVGKIIYVDILKKQDLSWQIKGWKEM
ncbi:DNA polymerase III subunit alpha [Mycoplasma zalophi]|uniref:DNA polymerase III subunit alpha n=1 Tax=Mycoplasma zalophi TaxID=191287 RepID=UPI0021C83C26|nr:DNA polymerase III subunit alpha [Mycoplasma zalophi]MCU4117146.1 DNA polymerase III subunit alpha [Mycoplasma zalophi]